MKIISNKAMNRRRLNIWKITIPLCTVLLFIPGFFILEYFRTDFKYRYPQWFISPSTMTSIAIFIIFLVAILLAIFIIKLAKFLSKDCEVSLVDDSIVIKYQDQEIIINRDDIDKVEFNNRGDYAKLTLYTKDRIHNYQFGLAAIQIKKKNKPLFLMNDVSLLHNFLSDDYERKDQIFLESNLEYYIYQRKNHF